MSKLVDILLLLGTTAVLWHQTEAKPFLFLPPKFFVLTTRAPTTDCRTSSTFYTSSSTSSASGSLFQLPADIISRKLSFISGLLSGFGSSAGSVSFGLGVNFNAGATTYRPITTTRSTTEPNTFFTPEISTKTPETTTKGSISTEKTSVIESTEKSVLSTTTEAIVSTTTNSTANSVQPTVVTQLPVITTTTKSDLEFDVSTAEITNESDDVANTDVVSINIEGVAADDNEYIQKVETVTDSVSSVGIDTTSGSVGAAVSSYNYQTTQVNSGASDGGYGYETPRTDTENGIYSGNLSNMYLPAQ